MGFSNMFQKRPREAHDSYAHVCLRHVHTGQLLQTVPVGPNIHCTSLSLSLPTSLPLSLSLFSSSSSSSSSGGGGQHTPPLDTEPIPLVQRSVSEGASLDILGAQSHQTLQPLRNWTSGLRPHPVPANAY